MTYTSTLITVAEDCPVKKLKFKAISGPLTVLDSNIRYMLRLKDTFRLVIGPETQNPTNNDFTIVLIYSHRISDFTLEPHLDVWLKNITQCHFEQSEKSFPFSRIVKISPTVRDDMK